MFDDAPAFIIMIALVMSVFLLGTNLHLLKRWRLIDDLPTSKAQGVFVGLVEVKGTAESANPLQSFLRECPCVHYAFQVQEHWSRTVEETYTDNDGKTQTRTRHESGWTDVAAGGETQDFYLRDDSGAVLIRPTGAKLEPVAVFEQTVSPSHPLYYAKGPLGSVPDSDHERRFVERAIELHASLYVVGQARERRDIAAAEIASDPQAPMFLISTRSEQDVEAGYSGWAIVSWFVGFFALAFAANNIGKQSTPSMPNLLPIALGSYLAVWTLGWIWMVYNSMVRLRARVRQGWSLIDVQLKRRHDLIPNIVAIVSALQAHEQTVQTTLAALRTQAHATQPGAAGPDFEGVAVNIRAVVEAFPELVAHAEFTRLHDTLVDTEQRIALARGYYNDIATQFATRLERVPDGWVSRLGAMRPEPLLAAQNFERAVVSVSFADNRSPAGAA